MHQIKLNENEKCVGKWLKFKVIFCSCSYQWLKSFHQTQICLRIRLVFPIRCPLASIVNNLSQIHSI